MKKINLAGFAIWLFFRSVAAQEQLDAPDYEKLLQTLETEAQQAYFENHYQAALRKWKQCTTIYEQLGDSLNIAKTKVRVGTIYAQVGEYATAFTEIKGAETLFSALNEQYELLQTYKTAARLHFNLANYAEMLSFYERGFNLADKLKSTGEKVQMLVGLGQTYYLFGNFEQARLYYRRALKLVLPNGPNWWQARIITYFGILAYYDSQIDSAYYYFEQAVDIQKSIEDGAGLKDNYVNLGIVHLHHAKLNAAGEAFSKALTLQKELHDIEGEIETEIRLGDVAYPQLAFPRAEQLYYSALTHAIESGDRELIAECHKKIGFINFSQNFPEKAERQLQEALTIARSINDPGIIWRIVHGQGLVSAHQNLLTQAFQNYYQALGYIELTDFQKTISQESTEFTRTETDVYLAALETARKLALRTQAPEWDERIFEISERKNARQLSHELESISVRTCSTTINQKIQSFRAYSRQFAAINALLTRERRKELLKQNIPKIVSLQKHLKAIETRRFQLQTEVQAAFPQLRDLFSVLHPTLAQFRSALQPGQVLLKYILLNEQLLIQVIQPDRVEMVDVASRQPEFLASVAEFKKILNSDVTNQLTSAANKSRFETLRQNLSRILLEPVQEKLNQATELIFLPDVPLQFFPFEALAWKTKGSSPVYLIEKFSIFYLSRAEVTFHKTNHHAPFPKVLNCVGFDPAAAENWGNFRKPGWAAVRAIPIPDSASLCPANQIGPGICQLDFRGDWYEAARNNSVFRAPVNQTGNWYLPDWFRLEFAPQTLLCLPNLALADDGDLPALLPEIFKLMGVRCLLFSQQPLELKARNNFLFNFYQNFTAGVSPAKSLQLAKIKWIHSPEYASPVYWTNFFLAY
jgi:tetratricopeptide (TPR) repeat protein